MGKKTRIGLPWLTERTYLDYRKRCLALRGQQEAVRFFTEMEERVRSADSLYVKFATDAAEMYYQDNGCTANFELMAGFYMLAGEGELPPLDLEKFEGRWNATMNRAVALLIVGSNMDSIKDDNPIYFRFIMDSARFFPRDLRTFWMSDASCGYMFPADNVVR